jgi:hypothetical protein
MKKLSSALIMAFFAFATQAWATPAQVLIIRHAEKAATGHDLSSQGQARAQALVGFFENNPEVTQYGTPAAIYAMSSENGTRTNRPVETVQPLAQALGLTIQQIVEADSSSMVNDILTNPAYDGKMVLICWVHQDISDIANQLGATQAPKKWDKKAYDRVWEIDYSDGQVSSFQDLPQQLMPGDSTN